MSNRRRTLSATITGSAAVLIAGCWLLLLAPSGVVAQDAAAAPAPAPAVASQPVQLFNGKDLTGWRAHFREEGGKMEDVWSVRAGGILHCTGKPNGYIRTEKDYTSFKLKLEWRGVDKPGNSGVLLRVQPPDKVWPKSIEAQLQSRNAGDIWNIDKFPMKVAPERTRDRHTRKMHETNEKPIGGGGDGAGNGGGEWNVYEITLDGGHLELKVNGLVQNVATDCQVIPGKIALQSEGAEIQFRNIELTPLPDNGTGRQSAATTQSAGGAGAVELFNGKDLGHFTAYFDDKSAKMEEVFLVRDGVLHCTGKPNGYIKTKETFGDFTLTFDWRWPEKPGNSGVLLRSTPPDKLWPKCFEAQLMHTNAADILPLGGFKATPKKGELGKAEKPPGEWNRYEIRMSGTDAELKVNGQVVSTATDCDTTPGFIGFQSEGAPIDFRDIKLTPIAAAPRAARPAGGDEAVRRLAGLDGWHVTGNGNWTIGDDGVIEGKQPKSEKSYTHVVSDKSFANFRASLKFKCLAGNSGFYFRVKPEPGDRMVGVQAEIDAENNVGGLYESYGRNWLSLPKPEVVKRYFRPQEWNEMTVEGVGPHVVVHVNGHKAGEINDPSIRTEGPFALQIHGGQAVHVMFKDLKVEELSKN